MSVTGKRNCIRCSHEIPEGHAMCPNCNAGATQGSVVMTQEHSRFGPLVPTSDEGSNMPSPAKPSIHLAIVFFSNESRTVLKPTPIENIGALPSLKPSGGTDMHAGFVETERNIDTYGPFSVVNTLVFSDGGANQGGGFFTGAKSAAKEAALLLRNKGVRIGTIAFDGTEQDLKFMRELASAPSLFEPTGNGNIVESFMHVTKTLTTSVASRQNDGPELFELLIDESGSMIEGTKKEEVEVAIGQVVTFLSATNC